MDYQSEINGLLQNQDYEAAAGLLEKWKQAENFEYGETAAILEGSILLGKNKIDQALSCIYRGLESNLCSHELYFMLGQAKEWTGNIRQAQVSYENALYYSNEEDYEMLSGYYGQFRMNHKDKGLGGVSIVLVTYNQLEMTKLCVDSIRQYTPSGTYEIIVVDNASTDGTGQWLQKQQDIRYILNDSNRGFPAACNQGAAIASGDNDIFLLNNDTVIMKNSIYNLRMALYEGEQNGAAGACSNSAGKRQAIEEVFSEPEGYEAYVEKNNCYNPLRHEKRLCLMGFAMMVRRDAWNETGGMEEIYGLGHFEDDDICMNLLLHDYQLVYCPDSFIFHFGHASFKWMRKENETEYNSLLQANREKFNEKWKIRWSYFTHIRTELIEAVDAGREDSFALLDVGCGAGATLLEIGNRFPNAQLYGIELDGHAASVASHYLNVVQGNIEEKKNPFGRKFDYIMLGDVLEHLHDTKGMLLYLKTLLNGGGHFIISLPNIMHISVINDLLHGKFHYKEEGILDRTHLRFFTKDEIVQLMLECGLHIERMVGMSVEISKKNQVFMEKLGKLDPGIPKEEFGYYQYMVKASV